MEVIFKTLLGVTRNSTFAIPQMLGLCLLTAEIEFKLRYLKNLKLFLVRVTELTVPIVLGKKRRIFNLFKSIFFRQRSLSNGKCFAVKKLKIWKGNLYLTGNRLSRNEMWHVEDNYNYNMYHICEKGILDSNFN